MASTAVVFLAVILSLTVTRSLQTSQRTKFTCLPRNGKDYNFDYTKKQWNTEMSCIKKAASPEQSSPFKYMMMQPHIRSTLSLKHLEFDASDK